MSRTSPEELLDAINSREAFLAFVGALVDGRRGADAIETSNPEEYRWAGANGWQNGTIAMFLESALAYAQSSNWADGQSDAPTWVDLARFLFFGKIYE